MVEVDQRLLPGLLALQMGFISREAAAEALRIWSTDDSQNLGQILTDRGMISAEQYSVIEAFARDLAGKDSGSFLVSTALDDSRPSGFRSKPSASHLPDTHPTRLPTSPEDRGPNVRFRRLRTHAEGGLGVVFVAHDSELNRHVALKEIKERTADDSQSRARFLLEAEVTGGLEHPGIVPVYSLGRHPDGRPYYAMRFIRGLTLQETIDRYHAANRAGRPSSERTLEFQKLLRVFLEVCNTISYAHSRGVIHRDIKPANIMLGKFGETLVVDWGLAKPIHQSEPFEASDEQPLAPLSSTDISATLAGATVGTPGYMSPEQAAGRLEKMGPTSDIYSLGATLYMILTGRVPFEGTDLWSILGKMSRGDFPRPRQHDASIPPELEAICLKAMSLRLVDRYPSAAKLAEDIEHWQADENISAIKETLARRLKRWSRKRRAMVGLLVQAMILTTVLSITAVVMINHARMNEQSERHEAESLSASLSLDRALARMDRGESSRGMLRLTQSLAIAPDDAADIRLAIRMNLGGWGRYLIPLQQMISLPGAVRGIVYTPDGQRIITSSTEIGGDSTISQVQVWDVGDGTPIGPPIRHQGRILAFAFAGDGNRVLTKVSETSTRLWNLATGDPVGDPFPHPEEIQKAIFRPGVRQFAVAGIRGTVQIWDAASGRKAGPRLVHPLAVLALVYSPDGTRLLTGCADGLVRIWDAETGHLIGEPLWHGSVVRALAFRPDGLRFASGGTKGHVHFWDVATRRKLERSLIHEAAVYSIVYNAEGTKIVTGCEDDRARLWDAEAAKLVGLPLEHRGSVDSVAFAPDGKSIATGSGDRTVRIWSVSAGRMEYPFINHSKNVEAIAYLADGHTVLIAGSDGKIVSCDAPTLRPLSISWDAGAEVRALVVRPGGGEIIVLTSTGKLLRFDPMTGVPITPRWVHAAKAHAAAYRPDGKIFMTGGDDGVARLWDDQTGKPLTTTFDHRWPVSVVAFHPSAPIVLTAGGSVARLWDIATGRLRLTLPASDGPIYAAVFSPDGRSVAVAGEDNMARVWDANDGKPIGLPLEHRGSVRSLAYSPDGGTLLTGGHDDQAVLWDVKTSKAIGPPLVHEAWITSLVFDPSGTFVLTGGYDRNIHIWPMPLPVADDLELVSLWVRATTGLGFDSDMQSYGVARVLDAETWRREKRALDARGGPPRSASK